MPDTVEYYNGKDLIVRVKSSIVPTVGSLISIRKETWKVISVTYAIDHADDWQRSGTRANVDLRIEEV